ncbi:MAG: general secretion pathway protein GspB [Gammaproteobacteria bacterium]|nr:general secretion pathway protein GspB [Gammaproteobacteria bacterium]
MSYILDSLRKAQQHRQVPDNDGSSDSAPTANPSGTSLALVPVLILSAVVAASTTVLAVLLMADNDSQPAIIAEKNSPTVDTQSDSAVLTDNGFVSLVEKPARYQSNHFSNRDTRRSNDVRPLHQELVSSRKEPDLGANDSTVVTHLKSDTSHVIHLTNATTPSLPATGSTDANLTRATADQPTTTTNSINVNALSDTANYYELRAQGIKLPDLKIELHLYADDRARRFAFINKQKYREGESIEQGLVVESITPQGVIINQNGRRFALTRN